MTVNKIRQNFVVHATKHVPSHFLLASAMHLGIKPLKDAISAKHNKKLRLKFGLYFSQQEAQAYKKVAENALVWHGTGRYQHTEHGVKDVLANILESGSLVPVKDIYDVFSGEMESISTTPSRIIARCYADTHNPDIAGSSRYGSSFFWVSYFYGKFYAELFFHQGIKYVRKYPAWRKQATKNGDFMWGKKVNRDSRSVWDTFSLGSDILNNYPIIFGIKSIDQPINISRIMAKAETRLSNNIPLSAIIHIEVPAENMNKTTSLINKYKLDLKVFPLEIGEYVASKQDFSHLLYPKTPFGVSK